MKLITNDDVVLSIVDDVRLSTVDDVRLISDDAVLGIVGDVRLSTVDDVRLITDDDAVLGIVGDIGLSSANDVLLGTDDVALPLDFLFQFVDGVVDDLLLVVVQPSPEQILNLVQRSALRFRNEDRRLTSSTL